MNGDQAALAAWLKTRPPCVQRLAEEFKPNTVFHVGSRTLYLIGWTENDMLIVSPVDPCKDFDGSVDAKEYLHANCARSTPKEKA